MDTINRIHIRDLTALLSKEILGITMQNIGAEFGSYVQIEEGKRRHKHSHYIQMSYEGFNCKIHCMTPPLDLREDYTEEDLQAAKRKFDKEGTGETVQTLWFAAQTTLEKHTIDPYFANAINSQINSCNAYIDDEGCLLIKKKIDMEYGITREYLIGEIHAYVWDLRGCAIYLADFDRTRDYFLTDFHLEHHVLLDPKNAKLIPEIKEIKARARKNSKDNKE